MGWTEVPTGTAHRDTCVVLRLSAPLNSDELAALCRRVEALIRRRCRCVEANGVVCDVTALDTVDLKLIDQLARVRLSARRAGGTVTFQHAGTALKALLAFTGLDDVLLADAGACPGSVQRQRETEQLDDPGVQEDIEVRHPPV